MKKVSAIRKTYGSSSKGEDAFNVVKTVFMFLLIIASLAILLVVIDYKNKTVSTAKVVSVERIDTDGTRRVGSGAYKKSVPNHITVLNVKLIETTGEVSYIKVNLDGGDKFSSVFEVGNMIEYKKNNDDIYNQYSYFKVINN